MPATVKFRDDVVQIILSGEFDFSSQDDLSNTIQEALGNRTVKEIQVDFANTTFIDSSFIRTLLKLRQIAVTDGKPLSLWNCSDQIREIFMIGGFDRLFDIR